MLEARPVIVRAVRSSTEKADQVRKWYCVALQIQRAIGEALPIEKWGQASSARRPEVPRSKRASLAGKVLSMSYDLMVIDPKKAPRDRGEFDIGRG